MLLNNKHKARLENTNQAKQNHKKQYPKTT